MKRIAAFLTLSLFAAYVNAACTITFSAQLADQTDAACFPRLDDAKCAHFARAGGVTMGASLADVDDAKKYGKKIMNFASARACEGKAECGAYVAELSSTAFCDGKAVQDMPGGEYRGLTAQAARQIQNFGNRTAEEVADLGKARGEKAPKGNKGHGKLWGND